MIKHISQSFIKDYSDYRAGNECGIIINEKYVNDRLLDDPEAEPGSKELGAYFEFVAFGTLPKSGIVPMPQMLANGKDMKAEYRLATINAKRVRELFDLWGLKAVKVNLKLTTDDGFGGTIDVLAECTKDIDFDTGVSWKAGDIIVIDLKYSGLIGETTPAFNKHGWKWSKVQKEYHGIQAKQYHYLTGHPFYFLVTQSNNKEGTLSDIKFFYIPITQDMVNRHVADGKDLFDKFQVEAVMGFTPRPSMKKCQKCPLREECTAKHVYPHPEIIDLNAA